MSIVYTCNLCGEVIAREAPFVILNGDGDCSGEHWRTGWVGHYHADNSRGCWQRILDTIRSTDGSAPRLHRIPTTTDESIAERRAKHNRPPFPAGGAGGHGAGLDADETDAAA